MKTGRIKNYFAFSIAIYMVFLFAACGKKGPPVPPGIPPLPAVSGFAYVIDSDIVRLAWNKPVGDGASNLKGYIVHRSKTAVDSDNCEGCPILFQRVAELNAGSEAFGELIENGHDYIYKVVAISVYGTTSPDSTLIKFRYDDGEPEKNNSVKDKQWAKPL